MCKCRVNMSQIVAGTIKVDEIATACGFGACGDGRAPDAPAIDPTPSIRIVKAALVNMQERLYSAQSEPLCVYDETGHGDLLPVSFEQLGVCGEWHLFRLVNTAAGLGPIRVEIEASKAARLWVESCAAINEIRGAATATVADGPSISHC